MYESVFFGRIKMITIENFMILLISLKHAVFTVFLQRSTVNSI